MYSARKTVQHPQHTHTRTHVVCECGDLLGLMTRCDKKMKKMRLLELISDVQMQSKARDEGWWAVLGCKETDELLALKRITMRRNSTSTVLSFLAPEDPGHACLTAYLVSDCYLGLDVESNLPFLLHPASS